MQILAVRLTDSYFLEAFVFQGIVYKAFGLPIPVFGLFIFNKIVIQRMCDLCKPS